MYHRRGRFAALAPFLELVGEEFEDAPYSSGDVARILDRLTASPADLMKLGKGSQALAWLVEAELSDVRELLNDPSITDRIDAESVDAERGLEEARARLLPLLERLGLGASTPPVFVVERLPDPYGSRGFAALTADAGDQAKHGIEPGVYFVKDRLRPYYSKYLLAHELIHVYLGMRSPELLARGLEEGIADFLGSFYLAPRLLGEDIASEIFVYNRLYYPPRQQWDMYLEATRQATYLYGQLGLKGLKELLGRGRRAIKETERDLLSPKQRLPMESAGDWDDDVTAMSARLTMTAPRSLVGSPEAVFLFPLAEAGLSVREVATRAGLPMDVVSAGLKELEERLGVLVLRADGMVVSSSDARFFGPTYLRSEIASSPAAS
jgi:hypothetical protein